MLLRLRNKESNLQKFFDSLSAFKPGRNSYTKADRFRDFREVFNNPTGKKVLAQIIAEAEGLPLIESEVDNHAKMSYRAGKRYVGLWIVKVLQAEPLEND